MKLYNLFEEVILEEVFKFKTLLSENVSISQIEDAIKNKYHVWILYEDSPDEPPSKRYIEVYALGNSVAGNKVIRAWQMGGPSKTTTGGAFKLFRVDRIRGWIPSKVKWNKAVSDLYPNDPNVPRVNKMGDKTMKNVDLLAKYAEQPQIGKPQAPKADDRLQKMQQAAKERRKTSYQATGNPVAKKEKPVDTSKTTKVDTSKTTATQNNKKEKINV